MTAPVRYRGGLICVTRQLNHQNAKLEFGGESPLTMRYERWAIILHPLGPSTISCHENWNLAASRR